MLLISCMIAPACATVLRAFLSAVSASCNCFPRQRESLFFVFICKTLVPEVIFVFPGCSLAPQRLLPGLCRFCSVPGALSHSSASLERVLVASGRGDSCGPRRGPRAHDLDTGVSHLPQFSIVSTCSRCCQVLSLCVTQTVQTVATPANHKSLQGGNLWSTVA